MEGVLAAARHLGRRNIAVRLVLGFLQSLGDQNLELIQHQGAGDFGPSWAMQSLRYQSKDEPHCGAGQRYSVGDGISHTHPHNAMTLRLQCGGIVLRSFQQRESICGLSRRTKAKGTREGAEAL